MTRQIPTLRPTNVRQWNSPCCLLPLRYPFSSGIPLPRAIGAPFGWRIPNAVNPMHVTAHAQ